MLPTRFSEKEYFQDINLKADTLSDLWKRNGIECPDTEAIVDANTRLTWREANTWIDRIALGIIEKNFNKNDVLVVQLPNSVLLSLFRVACERAGCLCLPLNIAFRNKEVAYTLKLVRAKGIVIPYKFNKFNYFNLIRDLSPQVDSLEHIFIVGDDSPDDTISIAAMLNDPIEKRIPAELLERTKCRAFEFSTILTTTGTTGFPKFVEYPICSRMEVARILSAKWKVRADDVVSIIAPTGGGPNVAGYLVAPLVKAKVAVLERFDSEATLQLIEKERITVITAVPTMLIKMVAHPGFGNYDLKSLRLIVSAGAPIAHETARDVESKMGAPIVQFYGSVDSALVYVTTPEDSQAIRFGTVGKPAANIEVQLVDDEGRPVSEGETGEIVFRCKGEFSGYFNDLKSTLQTWDVDGWFQMGDLGKWDKGGNLKIVGRKKEMIIRGGQNIYPLEIEDLLGSYPKIHNVAIIGIPDKQMGERACACIVTNSDNETVTLEEIVTFLKEKGVSSYKLPERIEIIDQLPMVTGGQKIDKKALTHSIIQQLKAEGTL